MRLPAILLLCAVLAILLSSAVSAAFTERLVVQAYDKSFRLVEGVEVYVDHELNSVTGTARTKSVFTNSSGMAEISFTNYEEIEGKDSRTYTVFFRYGRQLESQTLTSLKDNRTRTVSQTGLESYFVEVKARDQKGGAVRAALTVGNRTKVADAAGYATFQLPPGTYSLKAETADALVIKDVVVDKDLAVDVEIGAYPLEVKVVDDNNAPLSAKVQVAGREAMTDAGGVARFANLSETEVQVVVQSGQSVKRFALDLGLQSRLDVVFDRTNPQIKELHVTPLENGAATVRLYVDDPGRGASGIETVIVTYEAEGVESQVPAYSIGYNTFEAKIPIQSPGTLVKYVIRVTDKEGNGAFAAGDYAIKEENSGPQQPVNPPVKQEEPFGGIETVAILAVVAAIVIFGLLYYFRFRKNEGLPPQQKPNPPEIPQS